MNAVGIDVSKGRSTVAILRPMGEVVQPPEDVAHDAISLERLAYRILDLGEDTKVLMEATGRYHEAIAAELHEHGIFVSVVNPIVIHNYSADSSVRKAKNDKKDSIKIAKFCLDRWTELREYTPMDALRQQLKLFSRQYDLYMKTRVTLENNLISLTDKVFPGVNEIFKSPERADGHQKWVDFLTTFWHCECISRVSEKAFTERYQKWCRRLGYNFSVAKASDIYIESLGHIVTLPKNANTKLLIQTAAKEFTSTSELMATVKAEMVHLAKQLPEYDTVMAMYGVGEVTGPQLMAEIGDVRRFHSKSALVAFAGIDAPPYQSGQIDLRSRSISKRGSAKLRRTLFLVMSVFLQNSPLDEPIYQYMDKKRAEGKPYKVYMMATANKFLRRYYATVKAHLDELDYT